MPLDFCRQIRASAACVFAGGLAVAFSGCATTRTVMVEAMVNPQASSGFSYTIDAGNPSSTGMDARRAEVTDRVRTALSQRGLYEAPTPAQAEVVIRIDYGERDARTETQTVTQPVLVSPDPTATMGNTPGITIGSGGSYPSTYPGAYPSGSRSQVVMTQTTRTTRVSEKYIRISARENTKPRDPKKRQSADVWVVEAVIEDETDDVYECIPAMLDAATEYIGVGTGGREKVVVPAGS